MSNGAYPTESYNGRDYPAPGKWSLNWSIGQVTSWYYGDHTPDALFAHLYDVPSGRHIRIGDERIGLSHVDRATLHVEVAQILRDHAPDA